MLLLLKLFVFFDIANSIANKINLIELNVTSKINVVNKRKKSLNYSEFICK